MPPTDEDDSTMAIVNLNSFGSGEIVYDVIDMGTTDKDLKEEWVKLMVTFSWEAGNVIDSGEVAVSFHPVSTAGGDTFEMNTVRLRSVTLQAPPIRSLMSALARRRCCSRS